MKIKSSALLWILLCTVASVTYAQSSKHNISLNLGYGIGAPDVRYDFLYGQFVTEIAELVKRRGKDASYDDEYFLGIAYHYRIGCRKDLHWVLDLDMPDSSRTFSSRPMEITSM